jgi:hypothetical protein
MPRNYKAFLPKNVFQRFAWRLLGISPHECFPKKCLAVARHSPANCFVKGCLAAARCFPCGLFPNEMPSNR